MKTVVYYAVTCGVLFAAVSKGGLSPCVHAFAPIVSYYGQKRVLLLSEKRMTQASYGEYSVELVKPLGIILEEREAGIGNGVQVTEVVKGGAADTIIVPGDVLLSIGGEDVTSSTFDEVMSMLMDSPTPNISLSLSDGLGTMDMARNIAKKLSVEDAIIADAVVRAAVREIRGNDRSRNQLGNLISVEIVIGVGVQNLKKKTTMTKKRCMVRFFAIFSTDTVTTYSCSVSATGIQSENGNIEIVALSCAKDEGWGQTFDFKIEDESQEYN